MVTYTLNPHVLSCYGRPVATETDSSPAQATSCELVLKRGAKARCGNHRHRRCMLAQADGQVKRGNGSSEAPSPQPAHWPPGPNRAHAPHDPVPGDELRRPHRKAADDRRVDRCPRDRDPGCVRVVAKRARRGRGVQTGPRRALAPPDGDGRGRQLSWLASRDLVGRGRAIRPSIRCAFRDEVLEPRHHQTTSWKRARR